MTAAMTRTSSVVTTIAPCDPNLTTTLRQRGVMSERAADAISPGSSGTDDAA